MKSKNAPRCIDEYGRITVPYEMRLALGIEPGDSLNFNLVSNKIIVTSSKRACVFCGGDEEGFEFQGYNICSKCLGDIMIKSISRGK